MTKQGITHHGFRYTVEVKNKEEGEESNARVKRFAEWLLLLLVAGMTLFLVISFSRL